MNEREEKKEEPEILHFSLRIYQLIINENFAVLHGKGETTKINDLHS